jgi:hypothetical protein
VTVACCIEIAEGSAGVLVCCKEIAEGPAGGPGIPVRTASEKRSITESMTRDRESTKGEERDTSMSGGVGDVKQEAQRAKDTFSEDFTDFRNGDPI